jgi:thiol-disulfide isomerase/thioredoxin
MSRRARAAGLALVVALGALLAVNLSLLWRHRATLLGTPVGASGPDFTVPLLDGGQARLSDGRGHPTVLAFWATWCAPCRAELPDLDRVYHRFSGAPASVRFFAVNMEGGPPDEVRPLVRAFAESIHLTMPIALDPGTVAALYQVETIPRTVILDGEGRVRRVLDGAHSEAEMAGAVQSVLDGK